MRYGVAYIFGGYISVKADNEEQAIELVENMSEDELLGYTDLEIQFVEKE